MNRTAVVAAFFVCTSLFAVRAHANDSSTDTQGLRARVVEFSRSSGDTVTLEVEIDNDSDHILTAPVVSKSKLDDPIGRNEYLVLIGNGPLCSGDGMAVHGHRQVTVWAKFPAPPPGVSAMSIQLDGFLPMDDVPLR